MENPEEVGDDLYFLSLENSFMISSTVWFRPKTSTMPLPLFHCRLCYGALSSLTQLCALSTFHPAAVCFHCTTTQCRLRSSAIPLVTQLVRIVDLFRRGFLTVGLSRRRVSSEVDNRKCQRIQYFFFETKRNPYHIYSLWMIYWCFFPPGVYSGEVVLGFSTQGVSMWELCPIFTRVRISKRRRWKTQEIVISVNWKLTGHWLKHGGQEESPPLLCHDRASRDWFLSPSLSLSHRLCIHEWIFQVNILRKGRFSVIFYEER